MNEKERQDKLNYLKGLESSIQARLEELKEAQENNAKGNHINSIQSGIFARRRQIAKLKRELGIERKN